ncbi:LPS assembly protein LptD [Shewanella avicenniae]|uniref:LPS-assembly protein LptD n=1 Tax=Shewanella avicenniae TaxID=2814294 RepID=A0ABX7QNI4_9GAMM|nr:LPS assembly protein LptD [Shewanella avicenniae]QSX33031.1 LPS assembly protein LptD [Shewanella avicenniae]
MLKRYLVTLCLLPTVTAVAATAPQTDASSDDQCIITPPVPPLPKPEKGAAKELSQLIKIKSDASSGTLGDKATFNGNVVFTQSGRQVTAEQALVDQQEQKFEADGQLVFQDSVVTVTADSLNAKMGSKVATLDNAQYWLNGQQLHGSADKLEITKDNKLVLKDSDFSTCPVGDESWLLKARRIKIDPVEEWGEIWDAKLEIGNVPVFYMPYMTVPISGKRKTGFLFPRISSSTTNGFEFATPFYWNIAPEYDLTFTPDYMSSRGLFSKTEFRYLAGARQSGQFNLEFLGSDSMLENNADRWMANFRHQGAIDENWRVLANFIDVSDNNYFNDLNSDVNRSTENQLSRVGDISYFTEFWNFSARVQDIKVLGEDISPYQVMPQLSVNYRSPRFWNKLDFNLYTELTNFEHRGNHYNTATRFHVEPSISLPFQGPAGSLTSEVKLYQTYFSQRDVERADTQLKDNVSRTVPELRINGQVNFERFTNYFDMPYRQTLEPQFQYLYVGHKDQSNIGLYDTAELQQDYLGLFRDRRFSGLDRIADANQLTLGLTTRMFDEHNVEQFRFSLGQIAYFENSQVSLYSDQLSEDTSTSVLAAETDINLYDDWFISAAIQYDTKYHDNKKSEVTLDYRPGPNKLVQLSYRYVPDLVNRNTNDQVDISQAGIRTAWPLTDNVYFVGNYYYDLNESRAVETYTGFQYESCCWAVRFAYHYHIKTNYEDNYNPVLDNRELFETAFMLNFVIKGLGGSGPLGVSDMLDDGIFSYRKPLYLRN